MAPPPYAIHNLGSSYDRFLGDARSKMASINRQLAFEEAKKNVTAPTGPCLLLKLPPEIRTRIWENVVRGDGGVIHADLQDIWRDKELAPRLNIAFTCWQIWEETRAMFLPNNTFLFKAKDHLINDDVLESLADWLNCVSNANLGNIGRVVVCTNMPKGEIEYAWTQTGYMGADAGFVVGDRLDPKVGKPYIDRFGLNCWIYGCWGQEDGHHCTNKHFEMVYPQAEAKKLAKKLAKEEAEKRACKGVEVSKAEEN